MKSNWTTCLLLLSILLLAGCQTFPKHKVHYTLLDKNTSELPHEVLLMPLDITVSEMLASGMQEEVPEWTAQAKRHIHAELDNDPRNRGNLNIIPLQGMTEAQRSLLEQYTALYQTVAFNILYFTMNPLPAWTHKVKHFDYTLGDGLSFLAEQTGADTALFISGEDIITTSGRKAAAIFAAAFGVYMPLGRAVIIGSLVDLHTGDILWINYTFSGDDTTLTEREDAAEVMDELFKDYPGLEVYRKLRSASTD